MIHFKMVVLAVEVWLALMVACYAQGERPMYDIYKGEQPSSGNGVWPPAPPHGFVFNLPQPRYLIISCGKETININLETGVVDFPASCDMDEVAKNFWTAIGQRMPKECKP